MPKVLAVIGKAQGGHLRRQGDLPFMGHIHGHGLIDGKIEKCSTGLFFSSLAVWIYAWPCRSTGTVVNKGPVDIDEPSNLEAGC